MENKSNHTFHIPVMGLSYTIDSPIKVAHLGISSVMSIVEHNMIEKLREHYSKLFDKPFEPINSKIEDFRAKRITSYLNLVDEIVKEKVNKLRNSFEEKREELKIDHESKRGLKLSKQMQEPTDTSGSS